MKRIIFITGVLLLMTLSTAACGSQEPQQVIADELGMDVCEFDT